MFTEDLVQHGARRTFGSSEESRYGNLCAWDILDDIGGSGRIQMVLLRRMSDFIRNKVHPKWHGIWAVRHGHGNQQRCRGSQCDVSRWGMPAERKGTTKDVQLIWAKVCLAGPCEANNGCRPAQFILMIIAPAKCYCLAVREFRWEASKWLKTLNTHTWR